MKNLVIVESPAKAKTIEKILGRDFKVIATMGHFRDLPKGKLGIDLEKDYQPNYVLSKDKAKQVKALKEGIAGAETVWLASDLDREGEAIAWHVTKLVNRPESDYKRITFSEITDQAIRNAVENPRKIDQNLVDAQIARRIIDRLVGFELSPVLWKKVKSGLSAGRVQSVALKLIVDREKERDAFEIKEYWEIEAHLKNKQQEKFFAKLSLLNGKDVVLDNNEKATDCLKSLGANKFIVEKFESSTKKRNPEAPFTTSSLQQAANKRLGFSAKRTMSAAQKLYEAGKITYMRTDSVTISEQALQELRSSIKSNYGEEYLAPQINQYKTKTSKAQEAHEAIRPSYFKVDLADVLQDLEADQAKIYKLIYQRTLASQMRPAIFDTNKATIGAGPAVFGASGQKINFPGFLSVYQDNEEDGKPDNFLPNLEIGEELQLLDLNSTQHFTKPPARYNEASLIKRLEELGVGRPSTYAPIISTILDRNYCELNNKQLIPTKIGISVADFLAEHFNFVVEANFTAQVESDLDLVANGNTKWQSVVDEVYSPMKKQIDEKKDIERVKIQLEESDVPCPKCGRLLVIRDGRYGKFLGCPGFPECRHIENYKLAIKCPECGDKDGGMLIERKSTKGKFAKKFYGCSRYPECKFISNKLPKEDQS